MARISSTCVILLLAVLLPVLATGCGQAQMHTEESSRKVAEEFVRQEATFRFDGIPETLEVASTTAIGEGWQFAIEYESRHAGYGDRSGEALLEVITPHTCLVTVENGEVVSAVMDQKWDMIEQQSSLEIKLAPIHEVDVYIMESNPEQIGVHIRGGLSDGCTTFHGLTVTREGNVVNIEVTVQRPRGVDCPAIYTYFEQNVNLGTDFAFGTTFTLNVNDYTTTFPGTLMQG
ncbi:MAG: hypothetical protein JW954_05585 [Dehalococcoidaceae bacterium]|nr:hypothetical protein [Dehalococcoidaceae bacterium]